MRSRRIPPPPNLTALAVDTGTVVTELRMVPNQPLTFAGETKGRTEDSLIAYSWDKFLRGGDDNWPARLPMTKSAVRAMDSVTSFLAERPRRQSQSRQVRGLRRIEARLDHLDDCCWRTSEWSPSFRS